jgi:hypothetical protein
MDLWGKNWEPRRAGSRRAQAGVRGGAREKEEEGDEEKEKEQGPPIYEPFLDGLRFLTGWLQPVTYKYSESFNQSVPGVKEKPPWKYRLGIQTEPDFETDNTTRTPRAGESKSYDFGSGFNLLGGIATTIAYRTQISRELINAGQDRNESQTISWPDVSLRIQKFTTLPLLKPYVNWFIEIFSPRTAYSRQVRENKNVDRGFITDKSTTINQNPVLSLNFKLFRTLSMSGTYTVSETTDEKFNRANGEPQSEIRTVKKSYALSSKYAFSAPGGIAIPLFGKVKFKSTVSIDFSVKYSSNFQEKSTDGISFTPYQDQSSLSLSPVISYAFSQQIRGGLTGRWQDTNDSKFNKKTHIREIQIWTEINF